ncbi:MAG: hypothetical protein R3Y35_12475 [Clostridia bacterium]
MGGGGGGGGFGNTLGNRSSSSDSGRLYGKPNSVNRSGYKETYIGSNGRAYKEIHYSDHGNPKYHNVPHEHTIKWDENGNPIFTK